MTVPIESIKPGTVWRFKSGLRRVVWMKPPTEWSDGFVEWEEVPSNHYSSGGHLSEFARRAIERVTAPERVGGEGKHP